MDHSPTLIKLTRNKNAVVCKHDYNSINDICSWHTWISPISGKPYARGNRWFDNKNHSIYMHKIINKTPKGLDTDHINQNTLDNRCNNLRSVTRQQNLMNRQAQTNSSSGVRGVFWHSRDKKWTASIRLNRRLKFLGNFKTKEDAIMARRKAEEELFGEFNIQPLERI